MSAPDKAIDVDVPVEHAVTTSPGVLRRAIGRCALFLVGLRRQARRALSRKSDDEKFEALWETLLHRLSMARPGAFFLEVGASDGRSFDPLYLHVMRHRWRGILVEPLPDLFRQLVENYKSHGSLIFENVAIADVADYRDMYRVSPVASARTDLPKWSKGLASFFNDRNALGGYGISNGEFERIRPHVTTERVRCDTLAGILLKHKVARVDLLQVDVEGFDYQVLKQLDIKKLKTKVIRIGWVNLPHSEKRDALRLFETHGFQVRVSTSDLIAWRGLGRLSHVVHSLRRRVFGPPLARGARVPA